MYAIRYYSRKTYYTRIVSNLADALLSAASVITLHKSRHVSILDPNGARICMVKK